MITRICMTGDDIWKDWTQPILTSPTSYGTTSVSSGSGRPYNYCTSDKVLDGVHDSSVSGYHYWKSLANKVTGWWKWVLPYEIKISQIWFYNGKGSPLTKNAQFYADANKTIPLTDAFVAPNTEWGLIVLDVNNIITNTIYLDIRSSYSTTGITVGELKIVAKVRKEL